MHLITVQQICLIASLLDRKVLTPQTLGEWLKRHTNKTVPSSSLGQFAMIGELQIGTEEAEALIQVARRGTIKVDPSDIRARQAEILWFKNMCGGYEGTFEEYLKGIPMPPSVIDPIAGIFDKLTLVDRRLANRIGPAAVCHAFGAIENRDLPPSERDYGCYLSDSSLRTLHQPPEEQNHGVYWIRARAWREWRPARSHPDAPKRLDREVDVDVIEALCVGTIHPDIFGETVPSNHIVFVHGCGLREDGKPADSGSGLKMTLEGNSLSIHWSTLGHGNITYGVMTRIAC